MERKKRGYHPHKMKLVPRKPTDAEPELIKKIFNFAHSVVNFKNVPINWGKGTRGPKPGNPNALLAVWIYGYAHGNNMGRSLTKELKRNRDLQYLSKGALFSFSELNKFRCILVSCLDELLEMFTNYEGDPEGSLSIDGSRMECAGSHYQFRKVKDLFRLQGRHFKKRNNKRAFEYKRAIDYSNVHPDIQTVNLREHDARVITHRGSSVLGYILLAISDQRRRIYGFRVYGRNREIPVTIGFLEFVERFIDLNGKELLCDREYFDGLTLKYFADKGINAYVSTKESGTVNKQKLAGRYTKEDFMYDRVKDVYICPEGNILTFKRIKDKGKKNRVKTPQIVYQCTDCPGCSKKSKCLSPKGKYRELIRQEGTAAAEAMEIKMSKPSNRKYAFGKRRTSIEPVFGGIKDEKQGDIHRFILKGKEKVNIEALLMCIAFVLKLNDNNKDDDDFSPDTVSVAIGIMMIFFNDFLSKSSNLKKTI